MHKRRKIDYQQKNLKNPFFQRKKQFTLPDLHLARNKIFIIIAVFTLLILFWLLLFSNIFKIKGIKINGASRISSSDIESAARDYFSSRKILMSQSNLFLLSKKGLIESLDEKFTFSKISVDKKFPNKIIINIQEKSYSYIWSENGKFYYADLDGYLSGEINPLEIKGKQYPIIQNNTQSKINENKIDFDIPTLNFIFDLFKKFPYERLNMGIENFIIDNEINAVKINLISGPDLIFNSKEGMDKQFEKLITIKEDKLKDDFKNKTYIDLRFGDRVYYR